MRILPVFFFLLLLAGSSCSETGKPQQQASADTTRSLVIGNPLDCGIEGIQLFPVGWNDYQPRVYDAPRKDALSETALNFSLNTSASKYDLRASSEYINGNENEFDIRNILFYGLENGGSYPLTTDTVHILSFALHNEFTNPLIFC